MSAPLRVFYGGSFDPVHNGHIAIARAARDALHAEVALLPARDPPHKAATLADADEVTRMANSRAIAGLCLTTEANLGDGIFPAVDFLAQGGRMGIGSDSHVSLSVVEELRWLEYGQRLRDQRRNRLYRSDQPMVGRTLFDAALDGGAQALGQPIGRLQVGKRADWIVLDGSDPYLPTASEDGILNRWLFAGGDRQVRDVLVNGKWVVRDGHHAGEEDSSRAFTQVLKDLLN